MIIDIESGSYDLYITVTWLWHYNFNLDDSYKLDGFAKILIKKSLEFILNK